MSEFSEDVESARQLIDLLCKIVNANNSGSSEESLYSAHCLANKFIDHAISALFLCQDTIAHLPSFKEFRFLDSASIDVLIRACMEAVLVFHYVFVVSTDMEKRYKYLAYTLSSLLEKQAFPVQDSSQEEILSKERQQISDILQELESNTAFMSLNDELKKKIRKGGWRIKHWREIARDIGFSPIIAEHMYRHLSGNAHSSCLSVRQNAKATLSRENERLLGATMITLNIVIAFMIREYTAIFPKAARAIVKVEITEIPLVKRWLQLGSQL